MSNADLAEKNSTEFETSSQDIADGDEALKLVGLARREVFTEVDYQRVRRKLVSTFIIGLLIRMNTARSGYGYTTAMRSRILLSVFVSPTS